MPAPFFSVFFLSIMLFFPGVRSGDSSSLSGPIFLQEPANQIDFSNTNGTVVACIASGNPRPEILWFRNDGSLVTDVSGLRQVQTTGNLVFLPFRAEDYNQEIHSQLYRCAARNPAGSIISRDIHVRAIVHQKYQVVVNQENVILGNSVLLKCSLPSFVADFVFVSFWTISDESGELTNISAFSSDGKYMVLPTGELYIRDVSLEDGNKSYHCWTRHGLTGETHFSDTAGRLVVIVPVPLSVRIEPQIQTVDYGSQAILTCHVQGNPIKAISWMKDGVPLNRSDSVLMIEEVRNKDKGMYQCFVRNDKESVQASVELKVSGEVTPPKFLTVFTEQDLKPGSSVTFKCSAFGVPLPEITWEFDGKKITSSEQFKISHSVLADSSETVSYLNITTVQPEVSGFFKCSASNKAGRVDHSDRVNVYGLPSIKSMDNLNIVAGETIFVTCPVTGYPIDSIRWKKGGRVLPISNRQQVFPNGTLIIENAQQSLDEGSYSCVAKHKGFSVKGNLKVQFTVPPLWAVEPTNKFFVGGKKAKIECKAEGFPKPKISWKKAQGSTASDYQHIRPNNNIIIKDGILSIRNIEKSNEGYYLCEASNGVGAGLSAAIYITVQLITAPSQAPPDVKVEVVDQNTLLVSWKPPANKKWDDEILGYYVGYKSLDKDKPYLFETVNVDHHLKISHLKTYTQYAVVVQAFNKAGAGPLSDEVIQHTGEGVPERAPRGVTCTVLTSQSIRLSWSSVPLEQANGIIQGYKAIYAPSQLWFDEASKVTKIISTSKPTLSGLLKYTDYTVQLLAFTAGGDGVKSDPVTCRTHADVPESPLAVNALLSTPNSAVVNWKAPKVSNGIVNEYTVYIQEESKNFRKHTVSSSQLSYEVSGLKQERYSFWVTASSNAGEGEPSRVVTIAPGTQVLPKIASFGDAFNVSYRKDVELPCKVVGATLSEIQWKIKETPYSESKRIRLLPEGSLLIRQVIREDAGEYTCSLGQETITHHLQVQAPPYSPHVSLTSTTTTSITINVKPSKEERTTIHGYTVHYKPNYQDNWEEIKVNNSLQNLTIKDLPCGTQYQLYATAYNGFGTGDESDVINISTEGSKPLVPDVNSFFQIAPGRVILDMTSWPDGGCPLLYFVIEYQEKGTRGWTLVSNRVRPGGNFVVLDLNPGTSYKLRVTAHNNVGFTETQYEFVAE